MDHRRLAADGSVFTWFRAAAERGDAYAQFNLALQLRQGRGVPRDEQRAF